MTFTKAKQEFAIRYYLWAISEFEKEIDEGFPNFRSFKTGAVWELYQFMQQLPRSDQLTLAHGLLKRFHPDAVNCLRETCSAEEEALRWRGDNFFRMEGFPSSLEEQIAERKHAEKTFKFVSKRKMLKVVVAKFQEAFGGQCVEAYRVLEGDPSLAFEMKSCGWILGTHFWFGRRESLINYSHSIASETIVEQQGAKGKYMGRLVMASLISSTAWLGVTSQTEWECLVEEEAEPACDAAIKHCRHFCEVAPKLLQGLGPEKITTE